MSFEATVADVLRRDPVGRISFKIEGIAVNKSQMEFVAKAIVAGDVAVETGTSGAKLGASYSSFKGRRFADGEKKIIGQLKVAGPDVVKNVVGKAGIFHECVHALMDVKSHKVSMRNDEIVAYIADMMYMAISKTNFAGGTLEMAIYNAAHAIISKHKMLTAHNVSLKWSDCDDLRDAILAHPAYAG